MHIISISSKNYLPSVKQYIENRDLLFTDGMSLIQMSVTDGIVVKIE